MEIYRLANYNLTSGSVKKQKENEELVEHALMASRKEMKELVSEY